MPFFIKGQRFELKFHLRKYVATRCIHEKKKKVSGRKSRHCKADILVKVAKAKITQQTEGKQQQQPQKMAGPSYGGGGLLQIIGRA